MANPKISTLQDGFTSFNTTTWYLEPISDNPSMNGQNSGTESVSNGTLSLSNGVDPDANYYTSVNSNGAYDLTSSAIFLKLIPNTSDSDSDTGFGVGDAGLDNGYSIGVTGGQLYIEYWVNGGDSEEYHVTYSATNHAWLKISESGGTISFSTSPDSQTWTALPYTTTTESGTGWSATSVTIQMFYGSNSGNSSPSGAGEFQSLNVASTTGNDGGGDGGGTGGTGTGTKISQYGSDNTPTGAFELIGTDPNNTTMSASGTTEKVTASALGDAITGWHDLVLDYGADPTGNTSVASALANACAAASAAQPAPFGVTVPPGFYKHTAPQDLPYNLILRGAGAVGGDVTNQYVGSIFRVDSSFSGGSYAFGFQDTPHVSGATGTNGAVVSNIYVDGAAQTGTAVDGFEIVGPTMCTFENIRIAQMSGWAINASTEDSSMTEQFPFGQTWTNVTADSCGTVAGGGFNLSGCEDSVFIGCYSIGNNNGPGFLINACDNSKFIACNAEWNSNYGYYITGDWTWFVGGCIFTGCSTDANGQYGMYIDATWTESGDQNGNGPGIIMVSNCHFRRDGQQNATNSAGLALGATNLPVMVSNISTFPSIGDDGTGVVAPAFGMYFAEASYSQPIGISSVLSWGNTAAYNTAGTNGNLPTVTAGGGFITNVIKAHGPGKTPVYGS